MYFATISTYNGYAQLLTKTVGVPLHGGVDTFPSGDIAWTGGDSYNTSIMSPSANGCYHPMEQIRLERFKISAYSPGCNQDDLSP